MRRYLLGQCRVCGRFGLIDSNGSSFEDVIDYLNREEMGECPFEGEHREDGVLKKYVLISSKISFKNKEKAEERIEILNS